MRRGACAGRARRVVVAIGPAIILERARAGLQHAIESRLTKAHIAAVGSWQQSSGQPTIRGARFRVHVVAPLVVVASFLAYRIASASAQAESDIVTPGPNAVQIIVVAIVASVAERAANILAPRMHAHGSRFAFIDGTVSSDFDGSRGHTGGNRS